jgi:hypothetical protein
LIDTHLSVGRVVLCQSLVTGSEKTGLLDQSKVDPIFGSCSSACEEAFQVRGYLKVAACLRIPCDTTCDGTSGGSLPAAVKRECSKFASLHDESRQCEERYHHGSLHRDILWWDIDQNMGKTSSEAMGAPGNAALIT